MDNSTTSLAVSLNGSSDDPKIVSDAAYRAALPYMSALSITLGSLSVVCSAANSLLYWRQRPHTSAYYLLVLNAGGAVHSACAMANAVAELVLPHHQTDRVYLLLDLYVGVAAHATSRRTVVCMTALASLDRLAAIAFPLRERVQRYRRASVVWVICVVVSVVTAIHSYLILRKRLVRNTDGTWAIRSSELMTEHPQVFEQLKQLGRGLCFYFPLFVSCCSNLALLCVLRRHRLTTAGMRRSAGRLQPESGAAGMCVGRLQSPIAAVETSTKQCNEQVLSTKREVTDAASMSGTGQPSVNENTEQYPEQPNIETSTKHVIQQIVPTRPDGTGAKDHSAKPDAFRDEKKPQRPDKPDDTGERDRTRMVLTQTFVFVFLTLPRVLVSTVPALVLNRNLHDILASVADSLIFLSAVIMFAVSLSYSRQFRGLMVSVWLRRGVPP